MANADVTILNKAIRELGKRWDDLDVAMMAAPLSRREDIIELMEMVNIKITHLETKRNHLRASLVTVRPPTKEERAAVNDALDTLSLAVAKNQRWSALQKTVMSVLGAANRVRTTLDSRQA